MVQNDSTRAVYVTLTVARRRTVKALHLHLVTRSKAVVLVELFTEKPFIRRLYTRTLHGRPENTGAFWLWKPGSVKDDRR